MSRFFFIVRSGFAFSLANEEPEGATPSSDRLSQTKRSAHRGKSVPAASNDVGCRNHQPRLLSILQADSPSMSMACLPLTKQGRMATRYFIPSRPDYPLSSHSRSSRGIPPDSDRHTPDGSDGRKSSSPPAVGLQMYQHDILVARDEIFAPIGNAAQRGFGICGIARAAKVGSTTVMLRPVVGVSGATVCTLAFTPAKDMNSISGCPNT